MAVGLRDRGHEAELWYLYRQDLRAVCDAGARVLLDGPAPGPVRYLSLPWRVLKALRHYRPHAVVSFMPLAHVVGQLAAAVADVGVRVPSHRSVCNTYHPLLRIADRLWGSVGVYTRILVVSRAVADSTRGYPRAYRDRIKEVPNGVAWTVSPLAADVARRRFALPETAPLLLAVGRLQEQKNYPLLIDAVAGVPDLHLVVVGGGPLKEELLSRAAERGIADRLHLLGLVSREDIADLHRACDGFALASLYEGQSNALLEAMASGMLIFASDIPEQREVLAGSDGPAAGVLLPVDDAAAWSAAMAGLLLAGHDERRALQEAARIRAAEFTMARMIDGFEAAICE